MGPYPTREEIRGFAASLATDDKSPFFNRVSPNVDWEVMGTHPAAGRFKTLDEWKAGALGVVQKTLKDQIQLELVNIIGGEDQEWAVIELEANAVCKNGKPSRFMLLCNLSCPAVRSSDVPRIPRTMSIGLQPR
ncbi:hypothetical protein AC578_5417 [Pseudocercospora eumusae]|uniref:SnoaL-like domain-containing protein n=1 Tax=Pseudocercospora eumusae TaxID=321146 RepID=A0A139HJR2_9PEZI|nr:hypothetical protein AC578_5417 [Pseudocercospora eumusae]